MWPSAARTPGTIGTRLLSTPSTAPLTISLIAPMRQTSSAITVAIRMAIAKRSGSACGAILTRNTASTPMTAGPTPFITALVHASARTRSNTGRTPSIRMNDGKKLAAAAAIAPATPATL